MNRFQELQNKHVELLRRYETNKESADFLKDVREYTEQVLSASREINDSRERNQLRANLRFWGAYIYDRTGVYPNLSLLPSEGKAEPAALKAPPLNRRGMIIAVILVLAFIGLGGFLVLRGINRPYSQNPAETNTPVETSSLFATPVGPTPTMSDVQAFATATALTLQTATPTFIPAETNIPTATSTAESTGFIPNLSYSSQTCSDRSIEMAWRDFKADPGQSTGFTEIPDAVAYLSSLGSGEIVSQVNVVPDGDSTILELGETTSDESYLLQVRHPIFLFEPIIVQFTSDCTYNHLSITYSGESPIIDESTMDVELKLEEWGPDLLIGKTAWTAELSVKQDESGIYRYNTSPVTDQTFFVTGFSCATSGFTINRLGSGRYEGRSMSLFLAGPLCPKN